MNNWFGAPEGGTPFRPPSRTGSIWTPVQQTSVPSVAPTDVYAESLVTVTLGTGPSEKEENFVPPLHEIQKMQVVAIEASGGISFASGVTSLGVHSPLVAGLGLGHPDYVSGRASNRVGMQQVRLGKIVGDPSILLNPIIHLPGATSISSLPIKVFTQPDQNLFTIPAGETITVVIKIFSLLSTNY